MNGLAPIEHIPIDMGLGEDLHPAGRLRVSYRFDYGPHLDVEELIADFGLGADFTQFVRVEFDGPTIVRVLDETWLSTATDHSRWTGDLSSFARQVVGDDFSEMHSLFFEIHPGATHYQFVTDSACLDVLAASGPRFSLLHVNGSDAQPPLV